MRAVWKRAFCNSALFGFEFSTWGPTDWVPALSCFAAAWLKMTGAYVKTALAPEICENTPNRRPNHHDPGDTGLEQVGKPAFPYEQRLPNLGHFPGGRGGTIDPR